PCRRSYLGRSWAHSFRFAPRTLAIVAPVAVVGAVTLGRRWTTAVLGAWTLANPVLYSFYSYTPIHPRFLWASLPSFFVFWAAGAVAIVALALRLRRAWRDGPRRSGHAGRREGRTQGAPIAEAIGATEDAASRRPAWP